MRRLKYRQEGASAVEFALILPVFILLVFGIVEFSLAYNRTQGVHAASREGARIASFARPPDAIRDAIDSTLPPTVSSSDVDIDVGGTAIRQSGGNLDPTRTWCTTGGGTEQTVEVTLTLNGDQYDINIPLLNLSNTFGIDSSATFRCEIVK